MPSLTKLTKAAAVFKPKNVVAATAGAAHQIATGMDGMPMADMVSAYYDRAAVEIKAAGATLGRKISGK